jgi:hypothetical protein
LTSGGCDVGDAGDGVAGLATRRANAFGDGDESVGLVATTVGSVDIGERVNATGAVGAAAAGGGDEAHQPTRPALAMTTAATR